jgi:hypothetical protein
MLTTRSLDIRIQVAESLKINGVPARQPSEKLQGAAHRLDVAAQGRDQNVRAFVHFAPSNGAAFVRGIARCRIRGAQF